MIHTSVLIKVSLICFGLVLGGIAAEGAVRAFTYYVEGQGRSVTERLQTSEEAPTMLDGSSSNLRGLIRASKLPDVVYELRPRTSGIFLERPYQTNSFGARDQEYPQQKPANTRRIIGIGDSVMFGWGVKEEECYLSVLERSLQNHLRAPYSVDVINFGTPGYNTAMEVALLEHRAVSFHPDIVVLHVVNNDFEVPLFMERPNDILTLRKSFLWSRLFSTAKTTDTSTLVRLGTDDASTVLDEYKHLAGPRAFRSALVKLGELSRRHHFVVFVIAGRMPQEMRLELHKLSKSQNFSLVSVKEEIHQVLREYAIPNTPKERAAALQISPHDFHPNALGHIAYARALGKKLATTTVLQNAMATDGFLSDLSRLKASQLQ